VVGLLFRVVVYSVLIQFSFVSVRLIASLDALSHNAGSVHVGILIGTQALAPVFLAMRCGRWIDQVGPKRPVLIGAGAMLVALLFPVLLPSASYGLAPLYVCCLLMGFGYMFVMIDSQQLIGYIASPQKRTGAFAWLALGFSTTGLISPLIAGFLIDYVSHRAAFGAALATLIVGILFFLFCARDLPQVWEKAPTNREKTTAFSLLANPGVRNVLLVSALISMAWDLQHFMFPVYGHAIGLTASQIGLLVSVFFCATFLIRFVIPVLSQHVSEWQFLTLVLIVSGLSYAAFPLFDTLAPLLVVSFVLGLGLGCAQPNVMSLVHRETPRGRVGEALGIRTMIINMSHTALPSLFGVLTASVGVASIFMAMAALLTTSSWLCRGKAKKTPERDTPSQAS